MRVLEKKVELGEMNFKVQINRDIAVKSFEEYPDVLEYIVKNQDIAGQDFVSLVKNKGLSKLYEVNEQIGKLVEFALPLMLELACDKSDSEEILDYAKKNGVIEEVNAGLLGFIAQGFTQGELAKKPKIKFSMK